LTKGDGVTHLCIVRHGESRWNFERRVQGQLDPTLTELGEQQVRAVGMRLGNEPWDAIYSSDLTRARLTAAAIAERTGLTVIERKDLRERYQGRLEGLPHHEARERFPNWDDPDIGRESAAELYERAKRVFPEIANAHPNQRIIVVSHGGIIQHFFKYLRDTGIAIDTREVTNASVTRFEWGETVRVLSCNDVEHLASNNLLRPA